jgi:hypothetical protein
MSSDRPTPSTVRRADPALQARPSKDSFRPFGLPRWIGLFLYAFFWMVLLVPLVRRWRRRASWQWVRLGLALGGLALLAVGLAWSYSWIAAAGGVILLAALLLSPAADPDHERELQARHQADYFLNGGEFVSGCWPGGHSVSGGNVPGGNSVSDGMRLYLLLRGRELLAVPVKSDGAVAASLGVDSIREILVAGESYRPVYVSEAKDPPRREEHVDRSATTALELVLRDGERLRFHYTGAFSKHLAETAAHGIYSVRRLGGADGVGGESPEIFHIVGR